MSVVFGVNPFVPGVYSYSTIYTYLYLCILLYTLFLYASGDMTVFRGGVCLRTSFYFKPADRDFTGLEYDLIELEPNHIEFSTTISVGGEVFRTRKVDKGLKSTQRFFKATFNRGEPGEKDR
jgi:hypothetical protein